MSIQDISIKINHKIRKNRAFYSDLVVISIVFIVGVGGYLLGRQSVLGENRQSEEPEIKIHTESLEARPLSALDQTDREGESVAATEDNGQVIASKNGTKYHYPWCSGATRMKEENKLYFNSIEEARAAGYEPAGNCKGLK